MLRSGRDRSQGFAPLRTIDFAEIGLGDNLMAWSGLYALLSGGFQPNAPDCLMYVPMELAGLSSALFSKHGLRIEGVRPDQARRQPSPVFTTTPPVRLQDWGKTYLGSDWRMNGFEALDSQKTIPLTDAAPRRRDRIRLGLSERILYGRSGWRAAVAEYVGYRVWRPLARRMGILPLPFLTLMKRSLPALRADVARYVQERIGKNDNLPQFAIFPLGKAFQAFPAKTCEQIQQQLPAGAARFFVPDNDPWIEDYRKARLNLHILTSVEETFFIVAAAKSILTTDSFSSHVAQFMRDDFVLALTRDLRENIVHPGAQPVVVANHPSCAPCSYVTRSTSSTCSAKQRNCLAFDDESYPRDLARALHALSGARDAIRAIPL